mmetsp:Transcript_3128/g.9782  ORF Transcript_3128/g.9782 Transcript_3128/m.9782 type:complete len:203 (+) Transcript_3128:586-1194(+)
MEPTRILLGELEEDFGFQFLLHSSQEELRLLNALKEAGQDGIEPHGRRALRKRAGVALGQGSIAGRVVCVTAAVGEHRTFHLSQSSLNDGSFQQAGGTRVGRRTGRGQIRGSTLQRIHPTIEASFTLEAEPHRIVSGTHLTTRMFDEDCVPSGARSSPGSHFGVKHTPVQIDRAHILGRVHLLRVVVKEDPLLKAHKTSFLG